jgi:uncharacterized lipoprotein NlpE involved in copper resistance
MMITKRLSAISSRLILMLVPLALAGCIGVPNVVGDTLAAATAAITAAGLTVGTVAHQSSTTVPAGDVISESPAGLTILPKAEPVSLIISTGPPTYTISGTLIGLAPDATVDVLNGADNAPVSTNGSFSLPTGVVNGGTYSVTVGTPTSAQSCAVQNGSGTVAAANVTNVVVYCTYNVSVATLDNTYAGVFAQFDLPNSNGPPAILDLVGEATDDGMGNTISNVVTLNIGGTIIPNQQNTEKYTVTTTDAIPVLDGGGGIEGVNGDADVTAAMVSGTPSAIGISVLPNANATTDSVNGNYMEVAIVARLGSGDVEADAGPVTLTNGSVSGTYTSNTSGTIVTGNSNTGTFTISNGLVSVGGGRAQGAVSADGDLTVVADTNSGDNPSIQALVLQGTGVTQSTFEGIYSVAQYGGVSVTATFGKAITLFAYGNGTYKIIFTKNANGTITTNNTDSGTYTVAADGTLSLTDSEGNVYNGAISADGNALALGSVTSGESPAIQVGVRQ